MKVFTLAEAAEQLRTSKHALARVARRTGHCSRVGRALLFSEADLAAIWQATRVPAKADAKYPPIAHDRDISERAEAFLTRKRRR